VASEYSVNISLDTKKAEANLKKLRKQINNLDKPSKKTGKSKSVTQEEKILKLTEARRASMVRVRSIGDQINKAKAQGLNVDKASRALNRAALANSQGKFKLAKASGDAALLELKTLQAQTKELTQQKILRSVRNRGGFGGIGGGNGKRNEGRSSVLSGALISGAFPLLFGQGPLAAAGGFGGGLLGGRLGGQMGGFAGGLIGTAVVSGITSFANSITELGKSIETLDGQFNLLTQKSLFSSKEAENRAKVLQALGEREKLATLLSKELTTVLGEGGAKKLREAGEAAKELDKTFAELTINLQLLLVGPLTKFLKIVNDTLDPGMRVSLGEGKGDVIFGGKEEQFIKDFKGVLELFSQGQLDRIFKAAADLQINPADMKARSVLQAEGLGGLSDPELQAIRKFSLGKQVNPQSEFFGGDGSDINDAANNIIDIDVKRVAAANKKVKAMEKEIEFAKLVTEEGLKEADIQKQIQSITENLNEEELKLLDTQGLSVRALVEKNNQAKQLVENARMIEQSFKSLTQNISTDLAQGIQGLIRGTSTLNDVLNNVLNKMIDAAFNMAFFGNAGGTLTKGLGLFGNLFGGFLQSGGPARAGKSYIVGEKGPELFTPSVSGMVTPNSNMVGSTNIVVNVDASGSSVEGNEQDSRELGRLISVAVQSELVKQKRPGGILA
jgi:hypothetical protein